MGLCLSNNLILSFLFIPSKVKQYVHLLRIIFGQHLGWHIWLEMIRGASLEQTIQTFICRNKGDEINYLFYSKLTAEC